MVQSNMRRSKLEIIRTLSNLRFEAVELMITLKLQLAKVEVF